MYGLNQSFKLLTALQRYSPTRVQPSEDVREQSPHAEATLPLSFLALDKRSVYSADDVLPPYQWTDGKIYIHSSCIREFVSSSISCALLSESGTWRETGGGLTGW